MWTFLWGVVPCAVGVAVLVWAVLLARRVGRWYFWLAEVCVALPVAASTFLHGWMLVVEMWPTYLFIIVNACGLVVQFVLQGVGMKLVANKALELSARGVSS